MKKDLFKIEENNEECVVLKVKPNLRTKLICTGCFNGDEDLIRVTKGKHHTITVFRENGKYYSWEFGIGGNTIVAESMNKRRDFICEAIKEMGIDIWRI